MIKDPEFNQIKAELIERIARIEEYIAEGKIERAENKIERHELRGFMDTISKRMNGDYLVNPPVLGHEQRLMSLEKVDADRLKNKEVILKMAIGSFTIAVGGAVMWIFVVLKDAFIGKTH